MITRRSIIKNFFLAAFGLTANHRRFCTPAVGAPAQPLITSTFFEPHNDIFGGWGEGEWSSYFSQYKDLGFEKVFTHWASYDGHPFSGIKELIKGANAAQIKIVVGLANQVPCPRENDIRCPYSANIDKLKIYLKDTYSELVNIVEHHLPRDLYQNPSFDGWYLAEEVDGVTIADSNRFTSDPRVIHADRAAVWQDYFKTSVIYLENNWAKANRMQVYTSAYFGEKPHIDNLEFASFWQDVWSNIPENVDFTVLLQDERGTDTLSLSELRDYIEALKAIFDGSNRKFGIVLELFDQVANNRSPTTIAKLRQRIEDVREIKMHSGGLISEVSSFCVSHDIFNARNAGQARLKTSLGDDYHVYLQTPI